MNLLIFLIRVYSVSMKVYTYTVAASPMKFAASLMKLPASVTKVAENTMVSKHICDILVTVNKKVK